MSLVVISFYDLPCLSVVEWSEGHEPLFQLDLFGEDLYDAACIAVDAHVTEHFPQTVFVIVIVFDGGIEVCQLPQREVAFLFYPLCVCH